VSSGASGRGAIAIAPVVVCVVCVACSASKPAPVVAPAIDDSPCGRLCADEARCGATPNDGSCRKTCTRDETILRADVIAAIVACRIDALKSTCAGPKTAFTRGDLLADTRCLANALAIAHTTKDNRRAWSEASCDRMLRCQASGVDVESVRPACVAATMDPKEQDEREAMLVVDALKPSVIARWSACLEKGACPAPGKNDDVAESCLAEALERSPR
jgi:hypothetical protein